MMGKRGLRIAAALFLAALLAAMLPREASRAAGTGRKLTLMVYLCGSNLESGYGSASEDLAEMTAAGAGPETTVLVMAGGSGRWQTGYDPETCRIVEIGRGRQRTVRESGRMNMGEAATLTELLRFGKENYPAEDYALILWDHGGGPVEGVCWDELFSLDHLSLPELTSALEAAELGKKLKWIGFDACLMGSLEVAAALSPWAEYMIASQETEPAFGWNYSFLKDAGTDADGAETGRKIVDAYFEGHGENGSVLTLACLDLGRTEEVTEALDRFFAPLGDGVDEAGFAKLSGIRMHTTGFGKGLRDLGETGYDLVDARDLIRRLDGVSEAFRALDGALERMTVCSRSNAEGVYGISLYHPYANKKQYLEKWGEDYRRLGFSEGYTRYIRAFGALLTGGALAGWEGLETRDLGEYTFAAQLSPSQAENFVSAQLLVLAGGFNHFGEIDDCVLVYSGPAGMDGNGLVSGTWPRRTLYAEDENGELHGPLSFLLTDDGKYRVVRAVYTEHNRDYLADYSDVLFYLREEPGSDRPEIAQIRVWDEATGTYTNRVAFSEADYRQVNLQYSFRTLPDSADPAPWPAYMDWPVNADSFHSEALKLPQDWSFRYVDGFMSGEQYFAVLQITDAQQNTYCSRPVQAANPNLTRLATEEEFRTAGDAEIRMNVYRDASPLEPGLQLFPEFVNRGEQVLNLSIREFRINDTFAVTASATLLPIGPGETQGVRIDLPEVLLAPLEEIRSISFTVAERDENYRETAAYPVRFTLRDAPDAVRGGQAEILARTEQDGIVWELLGMEADRENRILLTLHVTNGSGKPLESAGMSGDVALDGLMAAAEWSDTSRLQPGEDTVVRITVRDSSRLGGLFNELKIRGDERTYEDLVLQENLLQSSGIGEIRRIILTQQTDLLAGFGLFDSEWMKSAVVLDLDSPFVIPFGGGQAAGEGLSVAEDETYSVRIHRLLAGDNGIGFCLEADNRMDRALLFRVSGMTLNGIPAEASGWTGPDQVFQVGPGMKKWVTGAMILPEVPAEGTPLEEIAFELTVSPGEKTETVRLRGTGQAAFGREGGVLFETEKAE